MDMVCKNCGHQIDSNALFCGNCGSKTEKEESKLFWWLMFIYPFFLFFLGYIFCTQKFVEDSDYNLGQIIGAMITFSIIPIIITGYNRLLKKKKLSDKTKVKLYYGISIISFTIFYLGQLLNKARPYA
jgi:hypothetical protein